MLERVYVRNHHSFVSPVIDLGALAEAALFYGDTQLVLSRASLWQLLDRIGAETLLELAKVEHIHPYYMTDVPAVHTEDTGSRDERHRIVTVGIHKASMESEVVEAFRARTSQSGRGRRLANQFLKECQPLKTPSGFTHDAQEAIRNTAVLNAVLPIMIKSALDLQALPQGLEWRAVATDDGHTRLETNGAWSDIRSRLAATQTTNLQLSTANFLVKLAEVSLDLRLAAELTSEISTSPFGAQLIAAKCHELATVNQEHAATLDTFQSVVLDGRNVRAAINSGERTMAELMPILENSRKFRNWITGIEIQTDPLTAYWQEVTKDNWAAKQPMKTFRFCTLAAPGFLTANPYVTAATTVLSALDEFVLERVAKGWRPNQFIDDDLKPFVDLR